MLKSVERAKKSLFSSKKFIFIRPLNKGQNQSGRRPKLYCTQLRQKKMSLWLRIWHKLEQPQQWFWRSSLFNRRAETSCNTSDPQMLLLSLGPTTLFQGLWEKSTRKARTSNRFFSYAL